MTDHVPAEVKRAVAARAQMRCEYCLAPLRFSASSFSVEHIVPRSQGGSSEPANLSLACHGCNNSKYTATEAADPVTGDVVALYNPRRHSWHEHFAWSDDFSMVLGLTPTGRATVEKLDLNREGLVNLRVVLREAGLHP